MLILDRRLALFRPPWTPENHGEFPDAFKAAAQVLVLAAGSSSAADRKSERDGQDAGWLLSPDVTRSIIAIAAYPLTSWIISAAEALQGR